MKTLIVTSTGAEIEVENYLSGEPDRLTINGKVTENFAFIAPNMEVMVNHFIQAPDTEFAVSIKSGHSITSSDQASLLSVKFNETSTIMPMGELHPTFVGEIASVVLVSFQDEEDYIDQNNGFLTITEFELLGYVTSIKLVER